MDGGLKLGIKFENFYNGDHYHPFGNTDAEAAEIEYMMKNNKVPTDILDYKDISGHFDVGTLAKYLDSIFETYDNLTITRKTIQDFNLPHDWIVDCTGFSKKDVTLNIPNNSALVYRTDKPINQYPYTTCRAMDYGWCWNIPLRFKTSVGYVHDDKHNVQEEFIKYLKEHFGIDADPKDIRKVDMITGRKSKHVNNNIISVGLASSFIEPIESTGLYLTIFGIRNALNVIQRNITAKEYDDLINEEFDAVADFIVAHYKFSTNSNEYWDRYKNLDCNLYRTNNLFPIRSWNYILQKDFPKIDAKGILKLRNGKTYKDWLNEKYTA